MSLDIIQRRFFEIQDTRFETVEMKRKALHSLELKVDIVLNEMKSRVSIDMPPVY